MAEQITNYQCPACLGPLQYSATSSKLECEYCGSSFEVAEIEAQYKEKDWLKISPPRKRELTDEQRAETAERLKNARNKHKNQAMEEDEDV